MTGDTLPTRLEGSIRNQNAADGTRLERPPVTGDRTMSQRAD
ncbi:hypothetical protein [Natronorubrum sulfidifaciens]|nr:hypothetical protein [Natronorubrum sulfidifaciens]